MKPLSGAGLVRFCHRVETGVDGCVHDGRLCDAGACFFACEIKMTRTAYTFGGPGSNKTQFEYLLFIVRDKSEEI